MTVMLVIPGLNFGQFAPPAGEPGTTAVHKDSTAIIGWATEVVSFVRGPEDITNPDGVLASFGVPEEALLEAEGNSVNVVSLGDRGSITLSFEYSIRNEPGNDFSVFENSFSDTYLEFAHVEVSTDGERFVRMPSISNIPTDEQIATYGTCDPTQVYNLAGKYRQGYGTPFDLEDIADSTGIDLNDVKYVRIVDVVGTIDPEHGTADSEGNLINDPYKTDFESGGFDLDGVGVMHSNDPTLSQHQEDIKIAIYPNPANEMFNIQSTENIRSVALRDMSGRKIQLAWTNQPFVQITLHQIPAGVYVLIIQMENGQLTKKKLVIQE